jgi:cytoskeleton protein RodZ
MKKVPSMSDLASSSLTSAHVLVDGGDFVADSAAPASAGDLLRQAREAAGLHIAALAVALKVPVKKLEALEADRFDLLPDAVFVRALASSVCRNLKIDASPVLQLLPQTSGPKLTYHSSGINTPFRAPSDGPGPSVWTQISRPAVLAGLVFLLGALVLILLPAVKTGLGEARSVADVPSVVPGNEPAKAVAAAVAVVAENADPARQSMAASDFSPSGVASNSAVSSAQSPGALNSPFVSGSAAPSNPVITGTAQLLAVATPAASAVPAAPASAALAASPAGIIVFRAKSESWVEVTDSKRQVVLRRILNAGEVAGVSGALPLSAIVGRADATQVEVRGKAFDLTALARDNVARFEVK